MSRNARVLAAIIAVIALASILGQAYVFIGMSREQGGSVIHAIWVMLGFFTILTNLIVAIACLAIARDRWPSWWPEKAGALGGLAVAITLVGAVYHLLLAHLWNPQGLHWLSDQGLHTLVPVLFLVFWLAFAPKTGLSWRHTLIWLAYPMGYFIYAMARGALDGWYPYPFLDAGKLGFASVLANAGIFSLVLVAGGAAFIALARALERNA